MSSSLNIGARALTTNLAALQVIGNNIANVNTAGYSRQNVQTQSAGYQVLGGLYFGKGVELSNITRSHSAYLTREAQAASSVSAADNERYTRMSQLESLFPIGEQGLGAAVNAMLNAWNDVASSPADLSARVVAISRGDDLAARMRDTATQLDTMVNSGRLQARTAVDNINRLAADIAQLNQRVIENQGNQGQPNDLLDQRDAALAELSQYVQISTVAADDGSVSVFVGGNQPLVLGQGANRFEVAADQTDPSQIQINFVQGGVSHTMRQGSLGGSLGGLMTFLKEDLPQVENLLGRMSLALTTEMNTQHQLGIDLQGNPGANFFVPASPVVGTPAQSNTGNAQVHSEVLDPTALKASDYQISFGASGVTVTRLSDGTNSLFPGLPADMDGLRFQLDSGAGAVGDTIKVRPFAGAARNMQLAIGAPNQLAVASPVMVTPGNGNTGGMSVESLYASTPSANLTDPVTITFLADGSFTATGLGPGNPPPDNAGPPASYNYTPGAPLQFNGWSLTLRGAPTAGETFSITAAPPGSGGQNAGNAEAVLAMRDMATFDGVPLSEGYGALLSHLGTQVQGAKFSSVYSAQVASNTEAARASVSGVNLDEEAARLLQYQQAYQASAKFLQIAQSTFDTLMQSVGR
ncbi:MAG: flagellar hook-associated protein FlgK [Burkholderiaceae bacterium]